MITSNIQLVVMRQIWIKEPLNTIMYNKVCLYFLTKLYFESIILFEVRFCFGEKIGTVKLALKSINWEKKKEFFYILEIIIGVNF